jgi:thiol-disulfide isomerase/thioredoxin
MLGTLFTVMQEPEVPSAAQHPGGKYDSLYAYQYYKQHYWDGVQFSDARLVRTPVFEQKLDKYYKELVVPVPDSIIKEVDKMMSQAVREPEMYKYLLNYFVQQYINPQYMGLDAVFVHLFEKYINNNPAVDWYDEKQQKYIQDRAYSLMANLVGLPAQNLVMVDTAGKKTELYSINAPFTVLCFWDPTCGHCKEMVPKLDSIYQKKWKAKGIKIVGVMVDGGKENWTKYIREQKLDWIHIYQTQADRDAEYAASKPNYRQLYDVYQTPVLYLLDKEKRIIAKKLDQNQIDDLITLKTKTP